MLLQDLLMAPSARWVSPGTVLELSSEERAEVISTPEGSGDRYSIRVVCARGGGPGITGAGPHTHPGLTEVFSVISGTMTAVIGKKKRTFVPGDVVEIPAGTVHGFVNERDETLVVDVDLVFISPGPRPEADAIAFAHAYTELIRQGHVGRRTGEPHLLRMAVLMAAYPEAVQQPGPLGVMLRLLAPLGRLLGYRAGPSR